MESESVAGGVWLRLDCKWWLKQRDWSRECPRSEDLRATTQPNIEALTIIEAASATGGYCDSPHHCARFTDVSRAHAGVRKSPVWSSVSGRSGGGRVLLIRRHICRTTQAGSQRQPSLYPYTSHNGCSLRRRPRPQQGPRRLHRQGRQHQLHDGVAAPRQQVRLAHRDSGFFLCPIALWRVATWSAARRRAGKCTPQRSRSWRSRALEVDPPGASTRPIFARGASLSFFFRSLRSSG